MEISLNSHEILEMPIIDQKIFLICSLLQFSFKTSNFLVKIEVIS